MSKFQKAKYIFTGLIIGSIIFSGIAFAASYNLDLFGVKLVFNGEEKQGSDKENMYWNGKYYVPTALIYNGTTYVPLRFFSESIGQPVDYESKSNTIYVGKIPQGSSWSYMLDKITPFYADPNAYYDVNKEMTMGGQKYNKGIKLYSYITNSTYSFNLASNYTTLKGIIGLDDKANQSGSSIEFYGDDKMITSYNLAPGSLPQTFNIDLKGVVKLDIKLVKNRAYDESYVDITNLMIQ